MSLLNFIRAQQAEIGRPLQRRVSDGSWKDVADNEELAWTPLADLRWAPIARSAAEGFAAEGGLTARVWRPTRRARGRLKLVNDMLTAIESGEYTLQDLRDMGHPQIEERFNVHHETFELAYGMVSALLEK